MIKKVSLSHLKLTLVRRRSASRERATSNTEVSHPNNQHSEIVTDSTNPRGKTNILKMLRRWKKKKKRNGAEPEVSTTVSDENTTSEVALTLSSVAKKLCSKSCDIDTQCPVPSPILNRRNGSTLEMQESVISAEESAQRENSSSHQQVVPVMVVTSTNEPEENIVVAATSDQHLCPGNLTRELFKLSRCGWYWGPISRQEAEDKLLEQTDGAFLVRDSSDDHYLLSLSFRSYGHILHTRIEHCNGLFSFYSEPEPEGHSSIVQLIEQSMNYSQSGVFCYSRGRAPNSPSYPVRLTKPVSRFNQVRTLQYLCRFVIRQYTRFDHIQKLPLPGAIKGYLEEGHY